jgi:hypothetical protein
MLALSHAVPARCQADAPPTVSADFAARFRSAIAATPAAAARDPNKLPHTCEGFGAYAERIVVAADRGVPEQKEISDINTNAEFTEHGRRIMRMIVTEAYAASDMTPEKADALAKASCYDKSHLFRPTPSQIDSSE